MRPAAAWHERVPWGILLGLVLALAIYLGFQAPPMRGIASSLEYDTLDLWFKLRDKRESGRVAVLAIDEATVQRWRGNAFYAPDLARLMRGLQNAGATSVTFAIPAMADVDLELEGEDELLKAIKEGPPTYLPLDFRRPDELPMGSPLARLTPAGLRSSQEARRHALMAADSPVDLSEAATLEGVRILAAPSLSYLAVAAGTGHFTFTFDRYGRARQLPLYLNHRQRLYPALSLEAAEGAGVPLPTERGGGLLLNYPYGARSEKAPFPIISVAASLRQPAYLEFARGRAVIIGLTAPGLASRYPAPTGQRISMAELQAVALDNLLSGRPLRQVPEFLLLVAIILPGVICGGLAAARRPTWSALVAVLCVVTLALISLALFWQDVWLDVSLAWITVGITSLVGVVGRARRQERETTHVEATIAALTKVSDIIAAQTEQWDLLDRVLHWSTEVLGGTGASALLTDESTGELYFAAALGPNSDQLLGLRLGPGEGIAGQVALTGQPLIVNDARQDNRFEPRLDESTGFATLSILCVPLQIRNKMLGVIEVVNKVNGQPFTPGDIELLQAVANQSAVALENARLYARLNQRVEQSQGALALAYRQLESEKNLLQTVLHSMTDGVVVTDGQGTIQLVNPAAASLLPELNRSLGEPFARALHDFPLAALPPGSGGWISEAWASTPEDPVILFRGDIDSPRHIEARSAPLRTSDGDLAGIVAVFADVTQRRQIEKAKSDFVSFVAHEMRSPLTSISGFSAMLQRSEGGGTPISPVTRLRFLGLIHEESERLTRLINNLLDVARIEAGRTLELHRDIVDIGRLVNEAMESQRAYSSRHTLVARLQSSLPPVYADGDKVTQILINLISNALKYAPGGQVTISATETQGEDGSWLEVSVQDEGPGIAPEQRRQLFERFERAPSPSQGTGAGAKPTGTGLGLFLTKYLVEAHGGSIWLTSEPGQGASFHFTLPLVREDDIPAALDSPVPG